MLNYVNIVLGFYIMAFIAASMREQIIEQEIEGGRSIFALMRMREQRPA